MHTNISNICSYPVGVTGIHIQRAKIDGATLKRANRTAISNCIDCNNWLFSRSVDLVLSEYLHDVNEV